MTTQLKTFWFLNSCIDRIQAQSDMRGLMLATVSQSPEASRAHRDNLVIEVGAIVGVDKKQEAETKGESNLAGFSELRSLCATM